MKYVAINYASTKCWIELDNDFIAMRQIVFENGNFNISCKKDCLAEGVIHFYEICGNVKFITADIFEAQWRESLFIYLNDWEVQKSKYPIGTPIVAKVIYFYPQGAVLQINDAQGICVAEDYLRIGDSVEGIVISYDESSLWLCIRLLRSSMDIQQK